MKNREFMMLQLFANDNNAYCDFSSTAAKALAGKDILLAVWNSTGDKLLAISGQQGLTINRSADSIEITSKDTEGGWKSKIAGMKEWSIDNDGLYVPNDESHAILSQAFENGDPVCLKVVNGKTKKGMFGGLAVITDYPLEAPHDVAGDSAGQTNVYVNPAKGGSNKYFYKTGGAPLAYPGYGEVISQTTWDGEAAITATTGSQIMIIETDSEGKALKAGVATVTSHA